jgi:hypothetical protein
MLQALTSLSFLERFHEHIFFSVVSVVLASAAE